jgi:hypothetical protein
MACTRMSWCMRCVKVAPLKTFQNPFSALNEWAWTNLFRVDGGVAISVCFFIKGKGLIKMFSFPFAAHCGERTSVRRNKGACITLAGNKKRFPSLLPDGYYNLFH